MNTSIIYLGDVRDGLRQIPDQSVQACVTSPPYWGLRDYGTANWVGGDIDCDHQGKPMGTRANINRNCGTGMDRKNAEAREFFKHKCGKCGAVREDDQIGLEATPQEFVAAIVEVFDEVWRVLKDDGVLWLNLGDSYASFRDGKATPDSSRGKSEGTLVPKGSASNRMSSSFATTNIKHKDLVGIPWRVAFALQDAGWYLRQDIIWHKPNPMPESVRDRCTKSHEYIFMLTKSPRYYFDNEIIKTPVKADWGTRDRTNGKYHSEGTGLNPHQGLEKSYEKANKRSVWSVNTTRFKGAHFAVMPEAIVEPCVLASSKTGDTILDPFTGSGTVAIVANRLQRNFVGCELNPEYADMAINRIGNGNLFVQAKLETLQRGNT